MLAHTGMALKAADRTALIRRGFTDEEIGRLGYRSMPLRGRDDIARAMAELFGRDVVLSVPGFMATERGGLSIASVPGLILPARDNLLGLITALTVRPDQQIDSSGKYLWVSSAKHGGPSPGSPPHVPLGVGGPSRQCG